MTQAICIGGNRMRRQSIFGPSPSSSKRPAQGHAGSRPHQKLHGARTAAGDGYDHQSPRFRQVRLHRHRTHQSPTGDSGQAGHPGAREKHSYKTIGKLGQKQSRDIGECIFTKTMNFFGGKK